MAMLLVMMGLTGFAISQPLLSALGGDPTFFAFRNIEGRDLVWFAMAVAFVPPLLLWLVTATLTRIARTPGLVLYTLVVAVLAAFTTIQVVKSIGVESAILLVLSAAAVGVAFAAAFVGYEPVRAWLRYTSILPIVAALGFLFTSETGELLRPAESVDTDAVSRTNDQPPPADVVMIVFDEFPTLSLLDENREIDDVRYPNFAGFAEDATWFRDFTTVATFTSAALPALLTGSDPTGGSPVWTNYPDNLFSLLAPTHHLTVFESPTELCGVDSCGEGPPGQSVQQSQPKYQDLLNETLDVFWERVSPPTDEFEQLDDFEESVDDLSSGDIEGLDDLVDENFVEELVTTPTRFIEFVNTFTPDSEPTLYFMHLLLPHVPWLYYEDGTRYSPPVGAPPPGDYYPIVEQWGSSPWQMAIAEQRHLLQASYTDKLLGLVIEQLKSLDMYDDSLIVVTGDHGASFKSTQFRGAGPDRVDPDAVAGAAYAPLLIKAPGQVSGEISDDNLMIIDVVPTIADHLGIQIPFEVSGAAAGSSAIEQREGKYILETDREVFNPAIVDRFEYTTEEFAPRIEDRWVGGIKEGERAVSGLYETLGSSELIGQSFDSILVGTTGTGGTAGVFELSELTDPDPDETAPGFVTGRIQDPASEREVLVAINGTVIGGSPQYTLKNTPGAFSIILDRNDLEGHNTIQMAIETEDGFVELNVVEV